LEDFAIGKMLGQGKFGIAHIAFHKSTGAVFAIKKVKKEVIKSNKLIDQFTLEVKLQSFFVHPFILKVYGIFDDETYIYLVLEFMEQGNLFNYLKKYKKLTEVDAA
jgi:serine/threonine protein kinase